MEQQESMTATSMAESKRAIEAIVLVSSDPIPAQELAQLLEVPVEEVESLCRELAMGYDLAGHGFQLVEVAGGWRYQTHPDLHPYVERYAAHGMSSRLSSAALETLAIVAYKQPISRAQVSAIRGVNVDGVLRTLAQRGYVEEVGRDMGAGQAILYGTTSFFLERLGINATTDLPALGDFVPSAEVVEALEQTLKVEVEPLEIDEGEGGAGADAALDAPAAEATPTEGEPLAAQGAEEALVAEEPTGETAETGALGAVADVNAEVVGAVEPEAEVDVDAEVVEAPVEAEEPAIEAVEAVADVVAEEPADAAGAELDDEQAEAAVEVAPALGDERDAAGVELATADAAADAAAEDDAGLADAEDDVEVVTAIGGLRVTVAEDGDAAETDAEPDDDDDMVIDLRDDAVEPTEDADEAEPEVIDLRHDGPVDDDPESDGLALGGLGGLHAVAAAPETVISPVRTEQRIETAADAVVVDQATTPDRTEPEPIEAEATPDGDPAPIVAEEPAIAEQPDVAEEPPTAALIDVEPPTDVIDEPGVSEPVADPSLADEPVAGEPRAALVEDEPTAEPAEADGAAAADTADDEPAEAEAEADADADEPIVEESDLLESEFPSTSAAPAPQSVDDVVLDDAPVDDDH